MLTEPSIDKLRLSAEIAHLYDLRVVRFSFVPEGEESWSYVTDCEDGRQYFVKIQHAAPPSNEVLEFVWQLRKTCRLEGLVCPIRTVSGEPAFTFDGYTSMLFAYIHGSTLAGFRPPADQLFRLGVLIARLHGCVELRGKCPAVEHYQIPFEDAYASLMDAARAPGRSFQAFQRRTAELLRRADGNLHDWFEALKLDQQLLLRLDCERVICHGEPSPGNVICAGDGQVYLIDWNTLILAPRERDLVFFLEPEYEAVLAGYWSVTKAARLNAEVVRFYRRQWVLGEIVSIGSRLLGNVEFDRQAEHETGLLLENLRQIGAAV